MMLSLEKLLLTVMGLAVIISVFLGPLVNVMESIEGKRDENCVNTAIKSVDLAITNAIGGGSSRSYVFLPERVSFECVGNSIILTAGNSRASLSYPFKLVCGGEAYMRGSFQASWKRQANGEASLYLNWERG